jgi:TldD protein
VSLSGNILRTLKQVDAVGKDFRLAQPGFCGKGQWVPVGDGGPHFRVRNCAVGGA